MTNLLKTIAIVSLFTIAGAQAQTTCEGSNDCVYLNESNPATVQHVVLNAEDSKIVCEGSENCLEIEAEGNTESNQATAQHAVLNAEDSKTVCEGSEHCLEIEAEDK